MSHDTMSSVQIIVMCGKRGKNCENMQIYVYFIREALQISFVFQM